MGKRVFSIAEFRRYSVLDGQAYAAFGTGL
jgi:hypothetical protein